MGGHLGAVQQLHVGQEPLVALDQRAAYQGRGEFHDQRTLARRRASAQVGSAGQMAVTAILSYVKTVGAVDGTALNSWFSVVYVKYDIFVTEVNITIKICSNVNTLESHIRMSG